MGEELRDLLCKYLKSGSELGLLNTGLWGTNLDAFATSLELKAPPQIHRPKKVLSELWSMVVEGIVEPGWSNVNIGGGRNRYMIIGFYLTEYGKVLLEGPPIDRPNQYIDYLKEQVSAINDDDEVITYVRESLTAYNHGCYFASMVMLGIASERLFDSASIFL